MAYNIDKLVATALSKLSARQKEVISCRFGLQSGQPQTLAEIGDNYGVTRERIRQIEAQALNTIYTQFQSGLFDGFIKQVITHLQKNNSIRKDGLLCQELKKDSERSNAKNADQKIRFFLEASRKVKYHPEDENFYGCWHLSNEDFNKANAYISKLIGNLKNQRGGRIADATKNDAEAANYVSLSKNFSVNVYGDFGLSEWGEINPKVSRDWAYLVLKKESKPLHFTKLSVLINKYRKNKRVNPQTIHNELIKDNRFVLVGRGTYGLREFNIVPGTAREVMAHFLKKHGPMASKDIVKLVLAQRSFKEKTLLLGLRNKKHFSCSGDGKYSVKEA